MSLVSQLQNSPLLGGQPALDFLQQIANGNLLARAPPRGDKSSVVLVARRDAAAVPALGVLFARL